MGSTDTLKMAFESIMTAFFRRDLEALEALAHDNVVFLGVFSPVRVEGKPALRQFFKNFFETHDYAQLTPLDPHFQVTDSIGLVWGSMMMESQPKRLERKTFYMRFSFTFGYFSDTWRLVAMHSSWLLHED